MQALRIVLAGCILAVLSVAGLQKGYAQTILTHKLTIGKTEFILPDAKGFIKSTDSLTRHITLYQNNQPIGQFLVDDGFVNSHLLGGSDLVILFSELDTAFIPTLYALNGLPTAQYGALVFTANSSGAVVSQKKYSRQHYNKTATISTQKKKRGVYDYRLTGVDTSGLEYYITIKPLAAKKSTETYRYKLPGNSTIELNRFAQNKDDKNKLYTAKIEAWSNGFVVSESKPIKFRAGKNSKKFDTKADTNLFAHPVNVYAENPLANIADPIAGQKKILAETRSIMGMPTVHTPAFNFSDIITAEGNFSVQGYYSNNTFNSQYQPAQYTRFMATPTVSVLGLPLKVNLFLSTENTPANPVNTFSVGFDADKFRMNMEDRAGKKDEIKRQIEAIRYQKLSTELKKIEAHKKRLADLHKEDSLLSIQSNKYLERKYKKPSLDSLGNKIPADVQLPDSLHTPGMDYQPDSAMLANDSSYLILKQGIEKRKRETDSLNRVIKEIEKAVTIFTKLYQNPSGYVTETLQNNPLDTIDGQLPEKPGFEKPDIKKKKPLINAVKKFNIGLFNPYISPLTLAGIPVKGGELELEFDRTFYRVLHGKTISTQSFILNTTTPQVYDRSVSSALVGFGNMHQSHLYLSVLYFSDKNRIVQYDSNSDLNYPKENLIYSVGGTGKISEKVTVISELNYSRYTENKFLYLPNTEKPSFGAAGLPRSGSYSGNLSFSNEMEYSMFANTTVKLNIKYLGPAYHSLGVPFLRTDYHEEELKVKQSFLEKKLQVDVSYKENRDNLFKLKSHTTVMRGAGITAKTNFAKYPNVLVSYIPFSVNSTLTNYPPNNSLPAYSNVQQISNVTNITLVNAYYYLAHKKTTYTINAGYTKNQNATTSAPSFSMETYNGNLMVSFPNRTTLTLFGSASKYYPSSDSLSSFTNLSGSYSAGIFRRAKLTTGIDYIENKNYRSSIGVRSAVQFTVKKIVYTLQAGYRKLQGNWGVQHPDDFFVQATITYRLQ